MPADSKSGLSWWLRKQSKTLALRKLHHVHQYQLQLGIQSMKSANAISLLSGLLNGSINFWTQSALTQRITPESTSASWTRDGSFEWVAALSITMTSPNHQAELSESTSSGWSQTNTTSPGLTPTNKGIDRVPLNMPWSTLIAASNSNTFVLNTKHATGNERIGLTFLVLSVGRRHSPERSAKPNDLATAELASDLYAAYELDQLREWLVDGLKTMDRKNSVQTKSRLLQRRLRSKGNPHHPANLHHILMWCTNTTLKTLYVVGNNSYLRLPWSWMSFVAIMTASLHVALISGILSFPITWPALEAGFFLPVRYW